MPPSSARQQLPALPSTPRVAPGDGFPGRAPSAQTGYSGGGGCYSVLPPALNAALGDHLSLLALEDWHTTHRETPGQHANYESKLLSCEARLRKLDHLCLRLHPPNAVVAAVVRDLLQRVFETLPSNMQQICASLTRLCDGAVYSEEPARGSELQQVQEVLGSHVDKLPHFVAVRRQQALLERLEDRAVELQHLVDAHMERRRGVLDFIACLQQDERFVLQNWLFHFWVVTFQHRRFRIASVANRVLSTPQDIATPFISWRIHVSQCRLQKAREECEAKDSEASAVANRIAEVEIENQEQNKQLQSSLEANTSLKSSCLKEQQEHERLQRLWEVTQPELLLSVLAQSFEFLFDLVTRSARLTGLSLRQRLVEKDVSPFLEGAACEPDLDAEALLLRWVNRGVVQAQEAAHKLMQSPLISALARSQLEAVKQLLPVKNLGSDLSDSTALCALFAVLRSCMDGRPFSVSDLAPLEERDLDLRAEQLCVALQAFAPTPRACCLLSPLDVTNGTSKSLSVFLASIFLQEPLLPDLPPDLGTAARALNRERLDRVLTTVEQYAGPAAREPPDDPAPLLHGGEDFQALVTASAEQLLLRWANVQLHGVYHRPVENFGSDLQDGEAIALLLSVVAPEVVIGPAEDAEERLEQIVAVATRCTDFELLSVNAIVEGQSDMLAAFFAQLFLTRPNLAAKPDSLLAMHLGLLDRTCTDLFRTLANPSDNAQVVKMCVQLDALWPEFTLATQMVHEAGKAMQGVNDRMRTFLGDTLAHRAQGKPRVMLDAKEAREFLVYTSLNVEHLQAAMHKEHFDSALVGRTEEQLRKHFRLLRDVFRHYASGGPGMTLQGLMKFYQDCKLRSKDLAPHHLEVLFCDHLDITASAADRFLSPNSFIEVLLSCANLKMRDRFDNLPEQLAFMIEHHLKPHACQETENVFQHMAYDPKVREVLDRHSKELKIIFQLYATMDTSTTDAMQRAHTMNIKEFHMLLTHCDMLDETLTEAAMQQIFDGIQLSATAEDELFAAGNDEDAGIDDDEELSLSEFLDGLVAIAVYKFPDPFTPFFSRVNTFILKLFSSVRRHWSRKRVSPQVDTMLNALQKKLR